MQRNKLFKPKKTKYYAYLVPWRDERGVTADWKKCESIVSGRRDARYKSFSTRVEAEAWLEEGAQYETKERRWEKLEQGIYFDAGTGRGEGVEISVTDEKGKDLLHKALPKKKINPHGKHSIGSRATNNYGELLACKYAIKIAIKEGAKNVFGDSRLVVDYWSRGFIKKGEVARKTVTLAGEVRSLRREFEDAGGVIRRISGDRNPADLGFH